ncbi:MAG: phenylalanine--tRNA ligase subunit alpha [Patescibacteria group bacterium]
MQDLSVISDAKVLEELEVSYLGRKGRLTLILKSLSDLRLEEKKVLGPQANQLRDDMRAQLEEKRKALQTEEWKKLAQYEKQDINALSSLRQMTTTEGHLHPLSNFILKVCRVFSDLGYDIADGSEIETDFYNFTALNIPADHPTRDDHDTFYVEKVGGASLKDQLLMRTQTSAYQVRYMQDHKEKLPIKVIFPGKTYRRDDDATHFPMFHQFEGLVVDKGLTLANLKATVHLAMQKLLGDDVNIRFRSSYFPFTEPSFEVDVTCVICTGKGCRVCKQTGWLELLGAGMVHPNVLKFGGIDPDVYTGFAFGTGIERLAMMKHAIPNIRYLYENDIRFLKQF